MVESENQNDIGNSVQGIVVNTLQGQFVIRQRSDVIYEVYSPKSKKLYITDPNDPFCECPDFTINRRRRALCKHLIALQAANIEVVEIQEEIDPEQKPEPIKTVNKNQIQEIPQTKAIAPILGEPLSSDMLYEITKKRINIDAIIEASKDGLGEGILYENTPIGPVPKEDLIALIARSFGIVSETIGLPKYERVYRFGEDVILVRAQARATHLASGASVVRTATVPMDFKRLRREATETSEGRTFADRAAESDACRRAELALMGIPEKTLVPLIKKMIQDYKKRTEKK